jgi:hypothetical protein
MPSGLDRGRLQRMLSETRVAGGRPGGSHAVTRVQLARARIGKSAGNLSKNAL